MNWVVWAGMGGLDVFPCGPGGGMDADLCTFGMPRVHCMPRARAAVSKCTSDCVASVLSACTLSTGFQRGLRTGALSTRALQVYDLADSRCLVNHCTLGEERAVCARDVLGYWSRAFVQ